MVIPNWRSVSDLLVYRTQMLGLLGPLTRISEYPRSGASRPIIRHPSIQEPRLIFLPNAQQRHTLRLFLIFNFTFDRNESRQSWQ